jgi:hypothetical protein
MDRGIRINNLFVFLIVGLFGLLWGIIPPFLWAAPSISSVSGTVSDGQTITVGGAGFGANGPTIKIFDDFQKGTNGNHISTAAGSAQVGQWDVAQGVTADTIYSTDYAHSGTQSVRFNYNYSDAMPCLGLDNIDGNPPNGVFASWWQYLPTNKDVPGTNGPEAPGLPNWKIFWLYNWTGAWYNDWIAAMLSNSLPTNACFGMMNDSLSNSFWPTPADGQWKADTFIKGQWQRYWFYLKASTTGDGVAALYSTNASSGFKNPFKNQATSTVAHPAYPWNRLHFPGFGRKDTNSILYYDDIYVATGLYAQARVEIGNNATYSKCTNLTILTPTLWSDTSITATVRPGSFINGSSAFLFVFDANGALNTTGYPITIGGPPPPAAPTGLKIVN